MWGIFHVSEGRMGSSVLYLGTASSTIDNKNRITIPAKFRNLLPATPDGKAILFVTPSADFRCLNVYDIHSGTELAKSLQGGGGVPTAQRREQQKLLAMFEQVELDRQGRILVPSLHREYAKLDGEITVAGGGDHLKFYVASEAPKDALPLDLAQVTPDKIAEIFEAALPEQG